MSTGNHKKSGVVGMALWKKLLIVFVLLLVAGGLGVYIFANSMLDEVEKDEEKMEPKELSCVDVDGYVNVLLLGVDSRNMKKKKIKNHNTDCIIVVSINTETKKVNLTSIYRDCYTKIADTPTYTKINTAYAYTGAKGAIQTVNQMMDLNIENYVLFNFKMVAEVVNDVGGITVDVKEEEIDELNKYTKQTAKNIKQKKYHLVKKPGKQTLEGVQAVSYGRIRKGVGDDFKRTDRMRLVIKQVTAKMQMMEVSDMMRIMKDVFPYLKTSMSNNDIIAFAQQIRGFKFGKSKGFPYVKGDGLVDGVSYVYPIDLSANVVKFHKEVFKQKDYQPSASVVEISDTIASTMVPQQ
jgi:LCP family protein required for cell wall assembly